MIYKIFKFYYINEQKKIKSSKIQSNFFPKTKKEAKNNQEIKPKELLTKKTQKKEKFLVHLKIMLKQIKW